MKQGAHIQLTVMALAATFAYLLMPVTGVAGASPVYPFWIDDIKGAIAFYQGDAYYKKEYPHARWELYLDQMSKVESAYRKGDIQTTYGAMNRFMDMLEAREGGIPVQPANELFNLCNFVTPPELHDVTRHAGPPRIEQPGMPERAQWPG
jgi:hypothetical protein